MKKPTLHQILAAVEESMFGLTDIGWCRECGQEHTHIEPDAENYNCTSCDAEAVDGCEIWLLKL